MQTFVPIAGGLLLALLMTLAGAAQAATFVYVSNAEDGDIGAYTLLADGSLVPGARVAAGKPVMPMTVSPDRRFLYASVRSRPYSVMTYAIDRGSGALQPLATSPLVRGAPWNFTPDSSPSAAALWLAACATWRRMPCLSALIMVTTRRILNMNSPSVVACWCPCWNPCVDLVWSSNVMSVKIEESV